MKCKKIIIVVIINISMFFGNIVFGQYQGPILSINNSYGADGDHPVEVINLTNDHFLSKDISVFYPQDYTTEIPTIFFSHGYGGNDTTYYIETLKHIASRGYAVVFVPYKTIGVTIPERYETLYDGFLKSARSLTSIIDTTKVGFYGHSFGSGATPRISFRAFTENNWGTNGRFIFCSAPWYSYELGIDNLPNFPSDCKMLTVLYDDDDVNDHRMGMDIFNNISIPDSLKDCLISYTDTIQGYVYTSDHNLPGQYTPNAEFDALDYYVTFRLLDAIAEYTFTGDLIAKDIALGNGSPNQIDIGTELTPLFETDTPVPIYEQSKYTYPCDTIINERQAYCQQIVEIHNENSENETLIIHPNPAIDIVKVNSDIHCHEIEITVYSIFGERILSIKNKREFSVESFTTGIYIVEIEMDKQINIIKLIKASR